MLIGRDGSVLKENCRHRAPEAWREKAVRGWKRNNPLHTATCLYFHSIGARIITPM